VQLKSCAGMMMLREFETVAEEEVMVCLKVLSHGKIQENH
jgi:hypothetical protein